MQYVKVWSLKQYREQRSGIIFPSEPLSIIQQHRIERWELERYQAQYERDKPLSIEEIWRLQGKACGYFKNGKKRQIA